MKFIGKSVIKKNAKQHGFEWYVKTLAMYHHIIVVLSVSFVKASFN